MSERNSNTRAGSDTGMATPVSWECLDLLPGAVRRGIWEGVIAWDPGTAWRLSELAKKIGWTTAQASSFIVPVIKQFDAKDVASFAKDWPGGAEAYPHIAAGARPQRYDTRGVRPVTARERRRQTAMSRVPVSAAAEVHGYTPPGTVGPCPYCGAKDIDRCAGRDDQGRCRWNKPLSDEQRQRMEQIIKERRLKSL